MVETSKQIARSETDPPYDWELDPDMVDQKSLPRMVGGLALAVGRFGKLVIPMAGKEIRRAYAQYRATGHTSGKKPS